MIHLNLEEKQSTFMHLPSTHKAKFMIWGDLKKTTQKAEEILQQIGKPSTPGNMFLAMVSVLNTCSATVCILVFLQLMPGCFVSFFGACYKSPPLETC